MVGVVEKAAVATALAVAVEMDQEAVAMVEWVASTAMEACKRSTPCSGTRCIASWQRRACTSACSRRRPHHPRQFRALTGKPVEVLERVMAGVAVVEVPVVAGVLEEAEVRAVGGEE